MVKIKLKVRLKVKFNGQGQTEIPGQGQVKLWTLNLGGVAFNLFGESGQVGKKDQRMDIGQRFSKICTAPK